MGKHEDFIFEGAKSKPGEKKSIKELIKHEKKIEKPAKNNEQHLLHKEHHKAITKYVVIGVVVLILAVLLSKGGYLNFDKSNVKKEAAQQTPVSNMQNVEAEKARIAAENQAIENAQQDYQEKLKKLQEQQTVVEKETVAIEKAQAEYIERLEKLKKAQAMK